MPRLPAEGYTPTTYKAQLTTPLFYSSGEGRYITTQPILSATALFHAIGYTLPDSTLEKRYVEIGSDSTTPTYNHLRELDFFVSDMGPLDVTPTEQTVRTTDYSVEKRLITTEDEIVRDLAVEHSGSIPLEWDKGYVSDKPVRNYNGLSPGSKYEFTIWTPEHHTLPDELRFEMGIRRSGNVVASKTSLTDTVTLNKYLLSSVFDIDIPPAEILDQAESFDKGNDPRLQHYTGVDRGWVDTALFRSPIP